MTMDSLLVCAGAALLVSAVAVGWNHRRNEKHHLPPGPRGLPLLGPLLEFPREWEGKVFKEWSARYGSDLIYIKILDKSILIVDKYDTVLDLLEKRSAIYSSRPPVPMFDLMGMASYNMGFVVYGDELRRRRRLFNDVIREQTTIKFVPLIQKAVSNMLIQVLRRPDDFSDHFIMVGATMVYTTAYGVDVDPEDTYLFKFVDEMMEAVNTGMPGSFLVNVIPALRHLPAWFPGCGFHKVAQTHSEILKKWSKRFLDGAKKQIAEGKIVPCFVSSVIQDGKELSEEDEADVINVAYSMMLGGIESTNTSLMSYILAIVLNPDLQQRAYEEIVRVCGPDTLPTLEDRDNLPYATATIIEALRWAPPTPIGVPRTSTADDTYNGYFIPKGTHIIANEWSISRDEEMYPDPDTYNPDRYIKNGTINPDIRTHMSFIFGYGRRICPGRHLADATIWLAATSLIAAFKFEGEGEVGPNFTSGIAFKPLPFKCKITPRSEKLAKLITALHS